MRITEKTVVHLPRICENPFDDTSPLCNVFIDILVCLGSYQTVEVGTMMRYNNLGLNYYARYLPEIASQELIELELV